MSFRNHFFFHAWIQTMLANPRPARMMPAGSGITSVSGSGSALISAAVTDFDPAFFKTAVSQLSFNSSLVTPFKQVSPSAMFTNQAGGGPPNVKANPGLINGLTGPDFQFQADADVSFTPLVIPEPASIILAGLGFASIVCVHAWKKK